MTLSVSGNVKKRLQATTMNKIVLIKLRRAENITWDIDNGKVMIALTGIPGKKNKEFSF